MRVVLAILANVWLLIRNGFARLRRPPEYVWIEVSGFLPEFEGRMSFIQRRLRPGPTAPSLERVRERLERISGDGRVRGVVLRIRNLDAGWAALEELRSELELFRERGGRVVAYLIEPDTRSYYLACAANEILVAPLATLSVVGVRARINFLKDALGKAGLRAEVIAVSPYKSAYDPLVRTDFSCEAREQTERLLDGRFSGLIEAIAQARGMSAEDARERVNRAPYSASEALSEGLVDGVCYEDELPERLGAEGGRAKLVEWNVAVRALHAPYRRFERRKVGVVSLTGIIVRGRSRRLPVPLPVVGGEQAGDESVVAALRTAEKSRAVAAILFHVDSGGGDALASDLIWREVERIGKKKPVVVLMGNVAASGGYYVGAAASRIFARRSTLTGSIGVITLRPVADGLYGKLGVRPAAIERGARSGMMDASHPPTADELEVLEQQIREIYAEFKARVSRGRELSEDEVESLGGGRVWTGAEAAGLGLVDEIGGYRAALGKARELAGIKGDGIGGTVKIRPSTGSRPAPGDPAEAVRETLAATRRALEGLFAPAVWAVTPYEISEDW